jgi:hypothetical protein
MYPIHATNKKESTTPSRYFMRFSFESLRHKNKIVKNQMIAPKREKLKSLIMKNSKGSFMYFRLSHIAIR